MQINEIFFTVACILVAVECETEENVVESGDDPNPSPYFAYLGTTCKDNKGGELESTICGSSIVNQYITLTAGHCLSGCADTTAITVSVGHENILQGVITTALSFVVHENFSADWLANDIALVRVKTPLKFDENVKRIALMANPPHGEKAIVAGWKLDNEKKYMISTNELTFTEHYVWNKEDCLQELQNLPDGTFCARSNTLSEYVSDGSALLVQNYIQIGVLSSVAKKFGKTISVYTDVGYFYTWIEDNVDKLICG